MSTKVLRLDCLYAHSGTEAELVLRTQPGASLAEELPHVITTLQREAIAAESGVGSGFDEVASDVEADNDKLTAWWIARGLLFVTPTPSPQAIAGWLRELHAQPQQCEAMVRKTFGDDVYDGRDH